MDTNETPINTSSDEQTISNLTKKVTDLLKKTFRKANNWWKNLSEEANSQW